MHTKGPWKAEGWEGIVINDSEGNTITLAPNGHKPLSEVKANAKLIAAAPELLDACKAAKLAIETHSFAALQSAYDLICKAVRKSGAIT